MRIQDIRQRLRALGANAQHEARLLRLWSQALPQTHGRRPIEHFLPARLRAELPALEAEWASLARLQSQHPDTDGSARLLVLFGLQLLLQPLFAAMELTGVILGMVNPPTQGFHIVQKEGTKVQKSTEALSRHNSLASMGKLNSAENV